MSKSLYSLDVLRMAASVANFPPLADPDAVDERRSPTCGSRMTVSIKLDEDGLVSAIGLEARACALGQAASSILASGAVGKDITAIQAVNDEWRAYLAGETDALPNWPGLDMLAAGRDYPARHPSMKLAFEAATAAMMAALAQKAANG